MAGPLVYQSGGLLGKGVVGLLAVPKILEEHHFRWLIAIEAKGIHGAAMDEAQTKRYISESVEYGISRALATPNIR